VSKTRIYTIKKCILVLQKLVKVEVPQRIKERSSKKSMAIDNLIARIEQKMEKMNTTLIIYRLKFEAPMRYQLEQSCR